LRRLGGGAQYKGHEKPIGHLQSIDSMVCDWLV
jgi:hypothetical protein